MPRTVFSDSERAHRGFRKRHVGGIAKVGQDPAADHRPVSATNLRRTRLELASASPDEAASAATRPRVWCLLLGLLMLIVRSDRSLRRLDSIENDD